MFIFFSLWCLLFTLMCCNDRAYLKSSIFSWSFYVGYIFKTLLHLGSLVCKLKKLVFILENWCLIAIFCKHSRCRNHKLVIVLFVVLLFHDSFLSTHNNEVTTALIKLLMADGYSEDQSLMLSRQIYTKLKQTPDEAGWSPQYVDDNDEVRITSVEE